MSVRICVLFIVLILLVSGCGEDDAVWENVAGDEFASVEQFMNDYITSWETSLQTQNFSIMEPYFIINSHVYHMQRRQHQQLVGARQREEIVQTEEHTLQTNQYNQLRWIWTEVVNVHQHVEKLEEVRSRTFSISRSNESYKITAIEHQSE
ncbi:hypothetical protein ACERII_02650 [Evansella sp. AB-rgal1]|uniref:TcaA NTF2-like domain-containing protein n=1 Tax=Evansella sp. AB-rgal1 TaxID=3242696 RepID=UPI00359E43B8